MLAMTSRERVVRTLNHEEPDRADGGIDVRNMSEAIRRQLPRNSTPSCRPRSAGGYVYYGDHSVPKDVSCPAFCKALELVRERG